MIRVPLRSVQNLLPRRRKNSELSAGKANVTAIIRQQQDFTEGNEGYKGCNRSGTLHYLRFLLLDSAGRNDQLDLAGSSTICTTKLFFSTVAGIVVVAGVALSAVASAKADDAGIFPAIESIAARNSCSRLTGRSTRTLSRPCS